MTYLNPQLHVRAQYYPRYAAVIILLRNSLLLHFDSSFLFVAVVEFSGA